MSVEATQGAALLPPNLDISAARRRLYEVAMELFGQRGFHAVSVRDLATALGQQSSAIYFHVSSKQDLLFELACLGHRFHFESLRDALMDAGPDSRDQLRAVVVAHVRVHLDYASMARLTNRELRALTPEQLTTVMAIRNSAEQVFIDVIERGVRKGAFRSADAFLTAKAIGAMGIRIPEWWTPDAPRNGEEILDQFADFALKLVSP